MGKYTEQEVRAIVNKASLLKKYANESSGHKGGAGKYSQVDKLESLFDISDDLDIPRKFVAEAAAEFEGIPVEEPIIVDNNDFGSTEVIGFARGQVNEQLLREMKARIEYHFNTVGEIKHRKNKITWEARPSGPSKFIAAANSPKVTFFSEENGTRIKVSQSLKTDNKLYLPAILATLAGILMITGTLFEAANGDEAIALLIFGTLFIGASAGYSRFVNRRKQKRKAKLSDLCGVLQQSLERSFQGLWVRDEHEKQPEIEIPEPAKDAVNEGEDFNLKNRLKNKQG